MVPVRALQVGVVVGVLALAGCSVGGADDGLSARTRPSLSPSQGTVEPGTGRDAWAADLPGLPRAACVNAPRGWAAAEWRRPGSVVLPDAAAAMAVGHHGVQAYLDTDTLVCGGRDAVHLAAAHATEVVASALRVGSYAAGRTARLVWTSGLLHVAPGPGAPAGQHVTLDAHWPASVVLHPTAAWTPGLYLLRLEPRGGAPTTYRSFVVESSGPPAPCLAVESDLTQLAYDTAGGTSLYDGPGATDARSRADAAWVASTHRGLQGSGLYQLFGRDVPLAVVLDHDGVPADWTTDTGLDASPTLLRGRACAVLPGHSEYWTGRAYAALRTAVDAGTNLAVLGGNEIYWQTRLVRAAGGDVAAMVVYRVAALDPVRTPADRTVQWRDPTLGLDPAALTGLGMSGVGVLAAGTVGRLPAWLAAGTRLHPGEVLPGVYGNEADGPVDTHRAPGDVLLLTARTLDGDHRPVVLATAFHVAASGAGVFDAGSTEWLCTLLGTCTDGPRPAVTRDALDRMTATVLRAFAAGPRAGSRLGTA